jgi:DNA-binding transcriptional LysR family regulator
MLVAVDESGTLTAAARRLGLTQSAVSHSLRRLEEDAGMQLVERNERGAALTAAGECLARHAGAILQRMAMAHGDLEQLRHWGSDRLRVGASSTACQYLLPQVLAGFRRQRPRCRVEVTTGDTSQRLEDLRSGRIDLAIVAHSGMDDSSLTFVQLFEEALCLVMPPAAEGELSAIGYSGGSSFAREAQGLMERLRPQAGSPTLHLESLEAIRSLVLLGMGMAVLPLWLVRGDIAAGRLRMETEESGTPVRNWSAVHRRGRRLSVSESAWIAECAGEGRKLMG